MSSTSRGGKRSPADFYATPAWAVHRLLERADLPSGIWFEPTSGEGHLIRAVNEFHFGEHGGERAWFANELRPECEDKLIDIPGLKYQIGNFFELSPGDFPNKIDVTITNPPFSLAMEVIEHALKFSPYVVMLLRLNFLGSEKRNAFFKSNMPDVYVVPDRISFTADGKSDSIEYAWFVWTPERNRRRERGRIMVLDCTPAGIRRAT